jgi:DNA-directed RNA polymerase specialized sigma24 family protein
VDILECAYKDHSKWLNIAVKLGAGDYAEDIVQEMYIKLSKYRKNPAKLIKDNHVNQFFVYVIIRNIIYDIAKVKKTVKLVYQDDFERLLVYQIDNLLEEWDEVITEEIKSWHWYDQRVFELIYHEGVGLRELSRETNISLSSIFNTVKNAKQRIKSAIQKEER